MRLLYHPQSPQHSSPEKTCESSVDLQVGTGLKPLGLWRHFWTQRQIHWQRRDAWAQILTGCWLSISSADAGMTAGKLGRERNSNQKTPNKTNKMSAAVAPGETDATVIQERRKQTGSQTNNPPEGGLESRFSTLYCLKDPGWLCHWSQTETLQTKETAGQHPSWI